MVCHQQHELGGIAAEQLTSHKNSAAKITLAQLWLFIFRNMSECHIVGYHFL